MTLVTNNSPSMSAIMAFHASDLPQACEQANSEDTTLMAALALAIGHHRAEANTNFLVPLLDTEGLSGHAAAWALAQLPTGEALLTTALENGSLDERENAYYGLCICIAHNHASTTLTETLVQRVALENKRAQSGRTGLGEHACRALAMLGDTRATDCIAAVMDKDQFCDRFEMQRLSKALTTGERDQESHDELSVSWHVLFADQLSDDSSNDEAEENTEPTEQPEEETAPETPEANEETAPVEGEEAPMPESLFDWDAFATSEEAAALEERDRVLITQLGPMFDQLAMQVTGKSLADCTADEVAAIYLQVLPQALPQQHMQAALSPQALNSFKPLCDWMDATALDGSQIREGITTVRQQIQAQMRASGSLHGSDYDEPENV